MQGVREFFETPKGKWVATAFLLVAIGGAGYSIFNSGESAEVQTANRRWFVDAESNQSFEVDLASATIPMISPFSGKATGYPAELCYWTKDGTPKDEPTGVLMNAIKDVKGPTFCHECGRLVVPYNPKPTPESKAPPTRAEYAASGRPAAE